MSNNKVPKIRFEEFRYGWQEFLLDEIVTRKSSKSNDINVKRVEYEDIVSGTGVLHSEWHGKGDSRTGIIFNKGDILYGYLRPYLKNWYYPEFDGKAIGDFWVLDSLNNDSSFIYSLIQSSKFQKLSSISSGSKMPRADWKLISKSEFYIPIVKREQQKIGNFFMQLENNISNKEKELTKLKDLKQAMLQKMFPKEGETVPEVRFEEFEDEYINVKFDDVATIRRGASPRPIDSPIWFDDKSDVGWLRISDVTSQNGRIRNLEQKLSTKGQEKTVVLEEEHLLLSIAATVGKPLINYLKTGVHDGFIVFFNPHFDLNYMFYFLEYFRPSWNKFGQPGSQVNINSELVKNLDISLPNIKEQKLIGEYFYKLDQNIQSKQAELDKLKQFKQAMLDKMFV